MGFLKDIILGKEKKITDLKLGDLKARIRNENSRKSITWISEVALNFGPEATVIILEGDSKGPFEIQIDAAYEIIDHFDSIKSQVVEKIRTDSKLQQKFKGKNLNEFYLACINPWEIDYNSFELSFDSINKNEQSGLLIIWQNKFITEIEIT